MDEQSPQWVMDASAYTHFCRAGHASVIEQLAPCGSVLIPTSVNTEIEKGRNLYPGIPFVASVEWAQVAVLTEEEVWTQLQVKAQMGGADEEHLGECAVIACARHRSLTAILDERAAVEQARRLGITTRDTLWIVIEAYKSLHDRNREPAEVIVDDLLDTGMYLPVGSGEGLFTWAYSEGLLP